METAPQRRAFQTLDGLRGVGALVIVMRHVPGFFGPLRVPESFLAVDLFYLVSGFVVAHAYGARLAQGGFSWGFFKTRIIRLYPLYFIGLVLGVITALAAIASGQPGFWTPMKVAEAFGIGLLMTPRFPALPINGSTLDGPIWTLWPELVANMVYAIGIRFMKTWVLVAIMAVSGAALVYAELRFHTLDVGYNLTDQWCAVARVGFSFFAGVLVYRLFGTAKINSTWIAWGLMAVLAVILAIHVPKNLIAIYEIGAVLVGMPVLIIAAARFEPDAWSGRLFAFVGLISYGIYIIHQPLGNLLFSQLRRFVHIPGDLRGVGFGIVFLGLLVLIAWLLDRAYDAPVRKVLRGWFMRERPAKAAA